MQFSEYYSIKDCNDFEFFDPFLPIDTDLFIDPFLIYTQEENEFVGSHDEVIKFFDVVFAQIAKSKGNKESTYFKTGLNALLFPEVKELCLGYSKSSIFGSGSSKKTSKLISNAIWESIFAGLSCPDHFEEIALLHKGIGADRISDAIANVLKDRLVNYTIRICKEKNVQVEPVTLRHGHYDTKFLSWRPIIANLPINPFGKQSKPILLIPKKYLRKLPTINAEDFWDYCYVNENEILRKEFGDDISRNVGKSTIIDFARNYTDIRKDYIKKVEERPIKPYDFFADDQGLYLWHDGSQKYANSIDLRLDTTSAQTFIKSIGEMLNSYKHFVEERDGYSLLWNDNKKAKREDASQLLCYGLMECFCKANDIDLSREAYVGRGYVDLKASRGYKLRTLIEIKKANNSRFWNGLEKQLPTYIFAEGIDIGYFIVIILSDNDIKKITKISKLAKRVNEKLNYQIEVISIDARIKKSASKL